LFNQEEEYINETSISTLYQQEMTTLLIFVKAALWQHMASNPPVILFNPFWVFSCQSCFNPLARVILKITGPTNRRFRLLLTKIQPVQQFQPHLARNLPPKPSFFANISTHFQSFPPFVV
jgi:hypothetical protein